MANALVDFVSDPRYAKLNDAQRLDAFGELEPEFRSLQPEAQRDFIGKFEAKYRTPAGAEQTGLPGIAKPPTVEPEYVSPGMDLRAGKRKTTLTEDIAGSYKDTIGEAVAPRAAKWTADIMGRFAGATGEGIGNIATGLGNILHALGTVADSDALRVAGGGVASVGKTVEREFKPEKTGGEGVTGQLPEIAGSAIGSMMGFRGAGKLVGRAVEAVAGTGKAGTIASWLATSAVETGTTAGGVYEDELQAGKDPGKAAGSAAKFAAISGPMTAGLNKLGQFNDRIRNPIVKTLAELGGEIAQEDSEQITQNMVTGKPWNLGLAESTVGAVFGSLIGGAAFEHGAVSGIVQDYHEAVKDHGASPETARRVMEARLTEEAPHTAAMVTTAADEKFDPFTEIGGVLKESANQRDAAVEAFLAEHPEYRDEVLGPPEAASEQESSQLSAISDQLDAPRDEDVPGVESEQQSAISDQLESPGATAGVPEAAPVVTEGQEISTPGQAASGSTDSSATPLNVLPPGAETTVSTPGTAPESAAQPDNRTDAAKPETPKHEFSSTQVNLPEDLAREVRGQAAAIAEEDLVEDGREEEPHVTVKYGLHGDDAEQVRKLLADEPPVRVKLGATSLFENEDADVVKVDVESEDLRRLNAKIAGAVENSDTHPEYKPHVTLGYVKPGRGKKYAGNAALAGREVVLDKVVFSDRNGNKTEIPLGGKAVSSQPSAISDQPAAAKPVRQKKLKAESRKLEAVAAEVQPTLPKLKQRPFAKAVEAHGRWEAKLLAAREAGKSTAFIGKMVDKHAAALRRHLGENYAGPLTAAEILEDARIEAEKPSKIASRLIDPDHVESPEEYLSAAAVRVAHREGHRGIEMNAPARRIIYRMMGVSSEEGDYETAGELVTGRRLQTLLDRAELLRDDADLGPFAGQLIEAIKQAGGHKLMSNRRGVIFIAAGSSVPESTYNQSWSEEIDHARQLKLGPEALRSDAVAILSHPAGRKAIKSLKQGGYENVRITTLAMEVGVRLTRPGRYAELGLTLEEAIELADHYRQALQRHGTQAAVLIRRLERTWIDEWKQVATSDSEGRGGGGSPAGGTGDALQQRGSPGVHERDTREGTSAIERREEDGRVETKRSSGGRSDRQGVSSQRLAVKPFSPYPPRSAGYSAYVAAAEAKYSTKGQITYLNLPAMNYVNLAYDSVRDAGVPAAPPPEHNPGGTYEHDLAVKMIATLRAMARLTADSSIGQALDQVAGELSKGIENDRPLIVVQAGPEVRAMRMRPVIRQELFHEEQFRIGGGNIASVAPPGRVLAHPVLDALARRLATNYGSNPYVLAVEAPAWIADGHWRALGLSREQAIDALAHYYNVLRSWHGEQRVRGILLRTHPYLREAVREQADRQQGPPIRSTYAISAKRGRPAEARATGGSGKSGFALERRASVNAAAGGERSGIQRERRAQPAPDGERVPQGRQGGAAEEVRRDLPGVEEDGTDRNRSTSAGRESSGGNTRASNVHGRAGTGDSRGMGQGVPAGSTDEEHRVRGLDGPAANTGGRVSESRKHGGDTVEAQTPQRMRPTQRRKAASAGVASADLLASPVLRGVDLLSAGVRTFREWKARLIAEYGPSIKHKAYSLWAAAKRLWKDESGKLDLAKLAEWYRNSAVHSFGEVIKPIRRRIAEAGDGAGRELMKLLDKAGNEGEVLAGMLLVKLRDVKLHALDREERFQLLDALEGRLAPDKLSDRVREVYAAARSVGDELAIIADDLDVMVTTPDGKRKFRARADYFPHVIRTPEALKKGPVRRDVIENLVRIKEADNAEQATVMLDNFIKGVESGRWDNRMLEYVMRTGQADSRAKALALLQRYRSHVHRHGTLEHAREVNLPFYDPDPARVLPWVTSTSAIRLAQIAEFGQDHPRINAEILKIRDAGGDADFVRNQVDRILGLVMAEDDAEKRLSVWLRTVMSFKLGLAQIPNATQGLLNTMLAGDFPAVAAGVRGMLTKRGRRLAIESGAAIDPVLSEAARDLGEKRMIDAFLKWTGFSAAEQLNRVFAANAGADLAGRLVKRLAKMPEAKRAKSWEWKRLEDLGVDPAEAAARGKLNHGEMLMAAKVFSDMTQFRTRVQDQPSLAKYKVMWQFKSFAYNQGRLIARETIGEWKRGHPGRAMRAMLVIGVFFPFVGELVRMLRDMIRGKDREFENAFGHYVAALSEVGGLGIPLDAVRSAGARRGLEFIAGPSLSEAARLAEVLASDKDSDEKLEALKKFAMKQIPFGSVVFDRGN